MLINVSKCRPPPRGGIRGHAVVPASQPATLSPSSHGPPRAAFEPTTDSEESTHLSFSKAFGVLGVPLLFIVIVCIAWTSWLILLTIEPNWTANQLMDTAEFDDGNFWLIIESAPWMTGLSFAGQSVVVLFYIYVLLKMLFWRDSESITTRRILVRVETGRGSRMLMRACPAVVIQKCSNMLAFWNELTGFRGKNRKFWVRVCIHSFCCSHGVVSYCLIDDVRAASRISGSSALT